MPFPTTMAAVDPQALARMLSSVDVRVGVARRVALGPGERQPLARGRMTLVYVAEGIVGGQPPLDRGCRLDVDRASHQVTVDARSDRSHLVAGDAFLSLGKRSFALESDAGAELMVVHLELADAPTGLTTALPDLVTVTDFVHLEPAAAAIAENIGLADPASCAGRSGDPVICRMMITTILLSLVRAWAENGCAPEGWPTAARDPYLNRVVEAIHDDPGQEWTVELLAAIGAMSRTVFAERFRSTFGRSPAGYVTEVRMTSARRMLENGMPVSTVARDLGYASDEGFSRAFRRHTGLTPSAWRLTHRTPALA